VATLALAQDNAFGFERWNGNGYPSQAKGDAIPRVMRIVRRRRP